MSHLIQHKSIDECSFKVAVKQRLDCASYIFLNETEYVVSLFWLDH